MSIAIFSNRKRGISAARESSRSRRRRCRRRGRWSPARKSLSATLSGPSLPVMTSVLSRALSWTLAAPNCALVAVACAFFRPGRSPQSWACAGAAAASRPRAATPAAMPRRSVLCIDVFVLDVGVFSSHRYVSFCAGRRQRADREAAGPPVAPGKSLVRGTGFRTLCRRSGLKSGLARDHVRAAPRHERVEDVSSAQHLAATGVRGRRRSRATARGPGCERPHRRRSTAAVRCRKTPRWPVWRRAIPSSSRSSSSGSIRTFESEPMQSAIRAVVDPRAPEEAVAEIGLGRRAGADRRPASASRSSSAPSAWVACTTVVLGPRQPVRASSSIGRQPCSARHSSTSRGCSPACTWSGRPSAVGVAAELLEPVARTGAHGVGGDADRNARRCVAARPGEVLGHGRLAHPVRPPRA